MQLINETIFLYKLISIICIVYDSLFSPVLLPLILISKKCIIKNENDTNKPPIWLLNYHPLSNLVLEPYKYVYVWYHGGYARITVILTYHRDTKHIIY
jgi:hypothetical protein